MRYLIVAQGEGEYGLDYSVTTCDADTPQDAVDWAVSEGYGQRRDEGFIFVARLECVTRYSVKERPTSYEAKESPPA